MRNFLKMHIEDRKAIKNHIEMYGTLDGFTSENFTFSKPLSFGPSRMKPEKVYMGEQHGQGTGEDK